MSSFVAAAEKTLENRPWLGMIYDRDRMERETRAADLFEKAAIRFKKNHEWKSAGENYEIAFKYKKTDPNLLLDAFKSYIKDDLEKAAIVLEKVSRYCLNEKKFTTIGKYQEQLGERFKKEKYLGNSLIWYQQAIENYSYENDLIRMKNCLIQIAEIYRSEFQDYQKAALYYERIADLLLDWSGTPTSCSRKVTNYDWNELSNYLLKAGLSWIHVHWKNPTAIEKKLQKYATMANFVTVPEYTLLQQILVFIQKEKFESVNHLLQTHQLIQWKLEDI
jgi:tetratricopeptide (TPR) repeat protein